jgi:uncharacterized protein (TIGR02328 family)
MRLWHEDIIRFLPRSQLLAQWRELNSIFAKEDKHILINYIYEYPLDHLYTYTKIVIDEFKLRGYNIRSFEKMERYFAKHDAKMVDKLFANDHNDDYFEICYFNLKEKYIRGQKDFDKERFEALHSYYKVKLQSVGE